MLSHCPGACACQGSPEAKTGAEALRDRGLDPLAPRHRRGNHITYAMQCFDMQGDAFADQRHDFPTGFTCGDATR
jgi:hypothetical protein